METEVQPGIGEYQSKLAEVLRHNTKTITDAFLFAKKRRDVTQASLATAISALNGLSEACQLTVHCMNKHEDREDFAKNILDKMNVKS
jgi:hypothetical protein